jgi:hypothetical protein
MNGRDLDAIEEKVEVEEESNFDIKSARSQLSEVQVAPVHPMKRRNNAK